MKQQRTSSTVVDGTANNSSNSTTSSSNATSNNNNNNGSSGPKNGQNGGAGAPKPDLSPEPNYEVDDGQNPGKMFIGGLSWHTSADTLRDYFSRFGEVNECMVMRDPATKRARGFGFITFADPTAVDKVLLENEHELDGKKIDPKVAFPKKTQPKLVVRTRKVFIGGLSPTSTLDDLKNYFQQYGKIEDAMLMFDKVTQRHRGFGFVTFDDDEVSDKVCEIHFHEINGKMVECKKAQPKEVMLPVQLSKSRAAAARNLYGLSPEQLLAYASYVPRMPPYGGGNLLYPGLFNGFSQSFGMSPSGRSSVTNAGASSSGIVTPRDLAAAQAAAQQHAYEAAVAYMGGGGQMGHNDYYHNPQQSIPNSFNKM